MTRQVDRGAHVASSQLIPWSHLINKILINNIQINQSLICNILINEILIHKILIHKILIDENWMNETVVTVSGSTTTAAWAPKSWSVARCRRRASWWRNWATSSAKRWTLWPNRRPTRRRDAAAANARRASRRTTPATPPWRTRKARTPPPQPRPLTRSTDATTCVRPVKPSPASTRWPQAKNSTKPGAIITCDSAIWQQMAVDGP